MKDYQSTIGSAASVVQEVALRYLPKSSAELFLQGVQNKTADMRPGLMFYGIYNSGKSTFLNALMGEEKAKVSDRPETSVVSEYLWNGYRVFDTPGIDAPIEHERVSRDHLKNIEIVVFVLSSDGVFDERSIYEEIAEIVKSCKSLLLIVNDKSNICGRPKEFAEVHRKIAKNLCLVGDEKGISSIEERVPVVVANARTALKSRLEGKPLLLEHSGIQQVEEKISELLKQTSIMDSVRTAIQQVEDFSAEVLAALNKELALCDTSGIERLRAIVWSSQERLAAKVNCEVEAGLSDLKSRLRSLFRAGTDETAVSKVAEEVFADISKQLDRLQVDFVERLGEAFATLDLAPSRCRPGSIEVDALPEPSVSRVNIKMAVLSEQFVTTGNVEKVLLGLRGLKVPGIKGRWASTLGKWAGKLAPAINIIAIIWDLIGAWRSGEKARQEAREYAQLVNQQVDEIVSSLRAQLAISVEEWIEDTVEPIEVLLDQQQDEASRSCIHILEDQSKILSMRRELSQLVGS